jgi:hypothetical protein
MRPSKEGMYCINQLFEAILLADYWYTATGRLRSGLAAPFPEPHNGEEYQYRKRTLVADN